MNEVIYTPQDWYWIIGGDNANVWSSKRAMSVPTTDQAYLDWTAAGLAPPPLADMAALEQLLAEQYPPGSLKSYNPDARYRKAGGGVIITSLSPIPFLTDPTSRNTINSGYQYAQANPAHITHWKLSDGTFIQLTSAQMATLNNSVTTFVQSCFTCENTNLTAITGGTITTIAQIDAAYAAISNVLP